MKQATASRLRLLAACLISILAGACSSNQHTAVEKPVEPAPAPAPAPAAVATVPPTEPPPLVPAVETQPKPPPTVPPAPAAPPTPPAGLNFAELVPGVRVDRAARVVEFDGTVPVDCHDPQTPLVFLEVLCCSPDTREHEALVVTKVAPSNLHAALLLIGLEAGAPGMLDFRGKELKAVPPTGSAVRLEFVWRDADGTEHVDTPSDWIINVNNRAEFPAKIDDQSAWRFAGSRMVSRRDRTTGQMREVYDADGAGTVIGLTTFGTEVIAFARVLSPDEGITPAEWIANNKRVPKVKTPVKVRVIAGN